MWGPIHRSRNRPNRRLPLPPLFTPRHPRLGTGICMASPDSWNSFPRPNPPLKNARSTLSLTSSLNNGVRHLCMTSNTVPNDCCHQGEGGGTVPVPFRFVEKKIRTFPKSKSCPPHPPGPPYIFFSSGPKPKVRPVLECSH